MPGRFSGRPRWVHACKEVARPSECSYCYFVNRFSLKDAHFYGQLFLRVWLLTHLLHTPCGPPIATVNTAEVSHSWENGRTGPNNMSSAIVTVVINPSVLLTESLSQDTAGTIRKWPWLLVYFYGLEEAGSSRSPWMSVGLEGVEPGREGLPGLQGPLPGSHNLL